MQSPDLNKRFVAAFHCLQPGHQHTFTLQSGRRSVGTLPDSDIRLLQSSEVKSYAEIEFSGALLWIRRITDRELIQIRASPDGPVSVIPKDDKFYQVLPENIILLGGCQFSMNFQPVCKITENTQILESLSEHSLSDSDSTDQKLPSLESHLHLPVASDHSTEEANRSAEKEPVIKTKSSAGFFSPQIRQLPVLSTPLKDASDAASPSGVAQVSIKPLSMNLADESKQCFSPLGDFPKMKDDNNSMIPSKRSTAQQSPQMHDSKVAQDPLSSESLSHKSLTTIPSTTNVASTTNALAASLSSPPLRRRNSIVGTQDEEKEDEDTPVSPPLGSSNDQYAVVANTMPLDSNVAIQPSSKSILHSKPLEASTPMSTRNRVVVTPGTELSSNRRRRRFGLAAPRPMPKLTNEQKDSCSDNDAVACKESSKLIERNSSVISEKESTEVYNTDLMCPNDQQKLKGESVVSAIASRKRRQISAESLHHVRKIPKDAERKPVVMFTGIASDDFLNIVSHLGGSVTEQFGRADILVCDKKIRRTVKFMCGLATAKAIVTDKWLTDSQKTGVFIDPSRYAIDDKPAEQQFGFCLADSIRAENRQHLLKGKSFWIAPDCNPKPVDFKPIIECSGGNFVDSDPSNLEKHVFIVSMPSLGKENRNLHRLGLNIYDKELVLTNILRQTFETEEFKIVMESVQSKSKRKKQ